MCMSEKHSHTIQGKNGNNVPLVDMKLDVADDRKPVLADTELKAQQLQSEKS